METPFIAKACACHHKDYHSWLMTQQQTVNVDSTHTHSQRRKLSSPVSVSVGWSAGASTGFITFYICSPDNRNHTHSALVNTHTQILWF